MNLRWAVVGGSGRMGRELAALLGEPTVNCDVTGISGEGPVDVLFDFSRPEAVPTVMQLVQNLRCPLVSGTTGLSQEQEAQLAQAANLVPMVRSGNFSRGITVMAHLVARAEALLADWDAEILETHHSAKVDAPSGTALMLAKKLSRPVEPKSLRLGGVPGDHTVVWGSDEELLSITHRAVSRRVLARGAVTAALALQNKPAGLYSFASLIGVEE